VIKMASRDDFQMVVARLAIGVAATMLAAGSMPNAIAGESTTHSFSGMASYYSHDDALASGGQFDPNGLTAAHPTLPFGTRVRITDPTSARSVIVVINDRGPFGRGRVIDLSLAAARALNMTDRGVIYVQADIIYLYADIL
jgi:rare lipoprotein A